MNDRTEYFHDTRDSVENKNKLFLQGNNVRTPSESLSYLNQLGCIKREEPIWWDLNYRDPRILLSVAELEERLTSLGDDKSKFIYLGEMNVPIVPLTIDLEGNSVTLLVTVRPFDSREVHNIIDPEFISGDHSPCVSSGITDIRDVTHDFAVEEKLRIFHALTCTAFEGIHETSTNWVDPYTGRESFQTIDIPALTLEEVMQERLRIIDVIRKKVFETTKKDSKSSMFLPHVRGVVGEIKGQRCFYYPLLEKHDIIHEALEKINKGYIQVGIGGKYPGGANIQDRVKQSFPDMSKCLLCKMNQSGRHSPVVKEVHWPGLKQLGYDEFQPEKEGDFFAYYPATPYYEPVPIAFSNRPHPHSKENGVFALGVFWKFEEGKLGVIPFIDEVSMQRVLQELSKNFGFDFRGIIYERRKGRGIFRIIDKQ